MEDVDAAFASWCQAQGVRIDGIEPQAIPGRGKGIIATRNLKKGDELIFVPISALLTVESEFVRKRKFSKALTVHGRLAAALALAEAGSDEALNRSWVKVLPTWNDFVDLMPILWPESLQKRLSLAAEEVLRNQQKKFNEDWEAFNDLHDQLDKDRFTYYWLMVNTRTFYWPYPNTSARRLPVNKPRSKLVGDDCMALCPFADYFNHADQGCEVTATGEGYTITCMSDYVAGDEVYFCYGQHSNDFLLVEYGFILDSNQWDHVRIDKCILMGLHAYQHDELKSAGYLGNYTLDRDGVCHRTEVGIRRQIAPRRWRAFANGGSETDEQIEAARDALGGALTTGIALIRVHGNDSLSKESNNSSAAAMLQARWQQIIKLMADYARILGKDVGYLERHVK